MSCQSFIIKSSTWAVPGIRLHFPSSAHITAAAQSTPHIPNMFCYLEQIAGLCVASMNLAGVAPPWIFFRAGL